MDTKEISRSDFINPTFEDLLSCINDNDFKVKTPPHNLVKTEFKKFVQEKNEERRKTSTVIMLRDFHNFIKKRLIINATDFYKTQYPKEKIHLLLNLTY